MKALTFKKQLTKMNTKSLINLIAKGGMKKEQANIAASLLERRIPANK